MKGKLLTGVALALTSIGVGATADAAPKTLLPIDFDCGADGTFTYAGRQQGALHPQGELDGRKTKLSEIWVEVSSQFSSGFIIANWDEPQNPNLRRVVCDAYYIIGPTPGSEFPGDYLFANGWVVIWVK